MKKQIMPDPNVRHRDSHLVSWSPEDSVFNVCVPELRHGAKTHGDTLQQAIEMAKDLIATHVESLAARGESIPDPVSFDSKAIFAPDVFDELPELRLETRDFQRWTEESNGRKNTAKRARSATAAGRAA
ncbi:MAG TPA: type II toxin-antitoxin system HicB family antitoxin [Tepidisphaeraceae bacterium]|nr:type II toxin-antitoxin system HicB family antitoxin [Tepidisphaeraceae bacterium]